MEGQIWSTNHRGSADLHTPIHPPPVAGSEIVEYAKLEKYEHENETGRKPFLFPATTPFSQIQSTYSRVLFTEASGIIPTI